MDSSGWICVNGMCSLGVDDEMRKAPYAGLFSTHANFTPTVQCATGYCTWESYETLGICKTCEDLSSLLEMSKVHTVPFDKEEWAYDTNSVKLRKWGS
jgi:hypothetical protein